MPHYVAISEYLFVGSLLSGGVKSPNTFLIFKRIIDIVTSLTLLPIILILCAVALVLNPFFNRGKLFYTQKRVGKNNNIFQIYKLRTMQGGSADTKFATEENSRITSLGRFMRDIHVDELPQIVNVLIGDMSLIGPRPERPEIFQNYAQSIQGFAKRQSVCPGISGLAQLRYGYTDCRVGAKHKLKWDLEYIRHQGFALDTQIYLWTFAYVFPRIGRRLLSVIKLNRNGYLKNIHSIFILLGTETFSFTLLL